MDQLWDRTGYGTLISTGAGDNYLHLPGGGVLRDGESWLHRDAVGSVRYSTDPTGAVTSSSAFTVFGEPRNTGVSDFGFAGEQTDPNSLIHLRARGYNPTLGSFMAYDPIQPGGPSTAGWNHYSYSANNPTTWSDPTGEAVKGGYAALLKRAAYGAALAGAISLWTCQEEFSWKGPFSDGEFSLGCAFATMLVGGIFGSLPISLGVTSASGVLGLCALGAADGVTGHAFNAWFTDADATVKGAIRDGGIGCIFGLLAGVLGEVLQRARGNNGSGSGNGNNSPDVDDTGPGVKGDGDDGGSGNGNGDDTTLGRPSETRADLLDELDRLGIKHDPDAISHIGRNQNGDVVFLEAGNSSAGLQHIVERHAGDFANRERGSNR